MLKSPVKVSLVSDRKKLVFCNPSRVSASNPEPPPSTINDPTVVVTVSDISLTVAKTATVSDVNNNSKTDAGDVINYTITVSNTGNATLSGIDIVDTLTDANSSTLNLDNGNSIDFQGNG